MQRLLRATKTIGPSTPSGYSYQVHRQPPFDALRTLTPHPSLQGPILQAPSVYRVTSLMVTAECDPDMTD